MATLILSPSYRISTSIYQHLQRNLQALCELETSQRGHSEIGDARREINQMGLSKESFSIYCGLAQIQGAQCCTKTDQ